MLFRKRRHKAAGQQARIRDGEADKSRERLHAIRENVTRPLAEKGRRNQFAEIIRASLIEGHGRG